MDDLFQLKQEMANVYSEAINLSIDIDADSSAIPSTSDYLMLHEAKDRLFDICHKFLIGVLSQDGYEDGYEVEVNYAGETQEVVVNIGEDDNVWIEFPDESYCEDREMDPFDLYNIALIVGEDIGV